jgi:hypothetical protein
MDASERHKMAMARLTPKQRSLIRLFGSLTKEQQDRACLMADLFHALRYPATDQDPLAGPEN